MKQGFLAVSIILFYSLTQAQERSTFNIRLLLNTKDGDPVPNLNISGYVPVVVTGEYHESGTYTLKVNRSIGEYIHLNFSPTDYIILDLQEPNKGIPITSPRELSTYIICRKSEREQWLKATITSEIDRKISGNNKPEKKSDFLDASASRLGKNELKVSELVASSRVDILSGHRDQVLMTANKKFLQGDYILSKKILLGDRPFEAYTRSFDQTADQKNSREISRQKLLLLGDNYLLLGKLDSSLFCYLYVTRKDTEEDIVTIFKIITMYELKGDLQTAYSWEDAAIKIKPRNDDDRVRLLVMLLQQKQHASDIRIADLDSINNSLNSITGSDPTLEMGLRVALAQQYSRSEAMDKMRSVLEVIWDKGTADYKLAGYSLLKQAYSNQGEDEAADSVNKICVERARISLAGNNSSSNRLLLDYFLLEEAIYAFDDSDSDDSTAVIASFNNLFKEFLKSPGWISELVVIGGLAKYAEADVVDEDSSMLRFYNKMIYDVRSIEGQYQASLLLSILYGVVSGLYDEQNNKTLAFQNIINCIKAITVKAMENRSYQYYLAMMLEATGLDVKYMRQPSNIRTMRRVLDYYWHYETNKDYMCPVILGKYLSSLELDDESLLLRVFNEYMENLPSRLEDALYWQSYAEFMEESLDIFMKAGNRIMLDQIIDDNLRVYTTKLDKQLNTNYNKNNLITYIRNAVEPSIEVKLKNEGVKAANRRLEQVIGRTIDMCKKDTMYKPVLISLYRNAIPYLVTQGWKKDTSLYSYWLGHIRQYQNIFPDSNIHRSLRAAEYIIFYTNVFNTTDTVQALATSQKDLSKREALEAAGLSNLLNSNTNVPEGFKTPAGISSRIANSYVRLAEVSILRRGFDSAILYADKCVQNDTVTISCLLVMAAAKMYRGDTASAFSQLKLADQKITSNMSDKSAGIRYIENYLQIFVKGGVDNGEAAELCRRLRETAKAPPH